MIRVYRKKTTTTVVEESEGPAPVMNKEMAEALRAMMREEMAMMKEHMDELRQRQDEPIVVEDSSDDEDDEDEVENRSFDKEFQSPPTPKRHKGIKSNYGTRSKSSAPKKSPPKGARGKKGARRG
ncbi:hypothetical protein BU23DRAFT_567384 [Bimuria novae-zelandiae CBS 107.79]|uniref:Uncharacterized protein n=1 Tax=Bimuria novae-zelandiae CBS 107.79 TaxID=1447943 RepID=A0A6A5VCN4_9PLEO|nr:hypothetical protein BU23DRAFT_567384 [Bimuria novae-zelandiae CBS 107.79]